MKNITVALDDDLYRKARVAAAQADTSVTALVREFLTILTDHSGKSGAEQNPGDAILATVERIRKRHPGFDPGKPLSREEVHSR